ncbi:MAG: hypothetical protein ACRDYX_06000 [Egibacteraceae bacterium]
MVGELAGGVQVAVRGGERGEEFAGLLQGGLYSAGQGTNAPRATDP